jgi:hypothetical protein
VGTNVSAFHCTSVLRTLYKIGRKKKGGVL